MWSWAMNLYLELVKCHMHYTFKNGQPYVTPWERVVIVLVALGIKKTSRKHRRRWTMGWKEFWSKKTGGRCGITVPSTHEADVHSSVCTAPAQTSAPLLSSKCILLYHFDLEELSKNNCPSFLPHYWSNW